MFGLVDFLIAHSRLRWLHTCKPLKTAGVFFFSTRCVKTLNFYSFSCRARELLNLTSLRWLLWLCALVVRCISTHFISPPSWTSTWASTHNTIIGLLFLNFFRSRDVEQVLLLKPRHLSSSCLFWQQERVQGKQRRHKIIPFYYFCRFFSQSNFSD